MLGESSRGLDFQRPGIVASCDTKPLRSARHKSFSIRCRRSLMALKKRGKYRYGDSQADIRAELLRYSK